MASKVIERFLNYIKEDTRADENSATFPSTLKQKKLGMKNKYQKEYIILMLQHTKFT